MNRAKTRAGILAAITGGTVTPVVITSKLTPAQSTQAQASESPPTSCRTHKPHNSKVNPHGPEVTECPHKSKS